MIEGQRSQREEPEAPEGTQDAGADDYRDYMADMILELRTLALNSGRNALAAKLLAAYDVARGERQVES